MAKIPERWNLYDGIRTIPDYPQPPVMFRDITPLLGHAGMFRQAVLALAEPFRDQGVTRVAALEARGFILGGAVALELNAGFVPLRKEGKLPHKTHTVRYALEYNSATLEMHEDAVVEGETVLIVDDLIATGGTALAARELLVERARAKVLAVSAVIDLPDLGGAELLRNAGLEVATLIEFPGE